MISEKIQLIQDSNVRKYVEEINLCISSKIYRGALVLLWSTVVYELVLRLRELKNVYNDNAATDILQNIEDSKNRNPTSPEWEDKLLKDIYERTKILNSSQYTTLCIIHKKRHLCAHPVNDETYTLYEPTKYEVLYFFDTVLDIITVPIYLSNKSFEYFVNDIAKSSPIYISDIEYKKYLDYKYFSKMSDVVKQYIFKNLWKFCFILDNDDSSSNRETNIRTIKIFIDYLGKDTCHKYLSKEIEYYSNVKLESKEIRKWIAILFFYNPELFSKLNEAFCSKFKAYAESENDIKAYCYYLSESFTKHIEMLKEMTITVKTLRYFSSLDLSKAESFDLMNLYIDKYITSGNYSTADSIFSYLIAPFIDNFTKEQLKALVKGIKQNSQTYDRNQSKEDHYKVYQKLVAINLTQEANEILNLAKNHFGNSIDW